MKHTKGTWYAPNVTDSEGQILVVASPDKNRNSEALIICDCALDIGGNEALGNAALISAAPDLLEIGEAILHGIDNAILGNYVVLLQKAVKKAKGL